MTKRILIAGHYGRQNAGDEVILQGILAQLRSLSSGLEFTVLTANTDDTRNLHDVRAVQWSDLGSVMDAVRRSSMVIIGGGGIFHDYWGADTSTFFTTRQGGLSEYGGPLILAHASGTPSLMYGVGVGPLQTKEGREMTRGLFELAEASIVRDHQSKAWLKEVGCDVGEVQVAPDPAFSAPVLWSERNREEALFQGLQRPVLAVCLRNWEFNINGSDWESEVVRALDAFLDRVGGSVLFVPMQRGESGEQDDLSVSSRVLRRMRNASRALVLRAGANPIQRFWALTRSDLVLGMRLHSLVAAIRGAVPLVGISYDPKITSLLRETSLEQYLIPLETIRASSIEIALMDAYQQRGELHERLKKLDNSMQERSARAARTAIRILNRGPVLERSTLFSGVLLAQLEARIALDGALLQTSETLERELERGKYLEAQASKVEEEISLLRRKLGDETQRARSAEHEMREIQSSRGWRLLTMVWRPVWSVRGWLRRALPLKASISKWLERAASTLRNFLPLRIRHLAFLVRTSPGSPFNAGRVVLYTSQSEFYAEYSPRRLLRQSHDPRVKVSLVATVKDEIGNISEWLDSLEAQIRQPDEVIIVDGGSKDGTWEALLAYKSINLGDIRVVRRAGDNIAQGRNFGVAMTKHDAVAFTDFGCRMSVDWLRNLMIPFEDDPTMQVVAGWYEPTSRSRQGAAIKFELVPRLSNIDPQAFLPSARSLAVRREALDVAGGFPEWLTLTGEDTYLDLQLKRTCDGWAFVPEACVEWHAPETLKSFWQKLTRNASGDGESGAFAGMYMSRMLRLGAGALLASGLAAVAAFQIWRWMRLANNLSIAHISALVILALVLGVSLNLLLPSIGLRLIAQIGSSYGFLQGVRRRPIVTARRYEGISGIVFVLTGVPIDDSGGGHRGAQLALEYARRGNLVIFVHKFSKAESIDLGLEVHHQNVLHYKLSDFDWTAFSYEYGDLLAINKVSAIVEFPLPEFVQIVEKIAAIGGRVAYDAIDDWNTSLGKSWYLDSNEKAIIDRAHVLIATSRPLAEQLERASNRGADLIPNAVDLQLFDRSLPFARPEDMPLCDRSAVYVGAVWGEWFDWDLLLQLAHSLPSILFVIIGDYRGQCVSPPDNLHFLGLKPQREVPAYLAHAQVGIIPWRLCAISRATSPLKAYEYVAMGLPIVTPDLVALPDLPQVFRSADNSDFIHNVEIAMTFSASSDKLDEFLLRNTWSCRIDKLEGLIERSRAAS
ncbi:MAG: polysaccharide pyruvyl transferase family protein [Chloroflexi bacterium]|nr:polysaccharide pyruvyl transferase family protein [Chloroflexota bacterium]